MVKLLGFLLQSKLVTGFVTAKLGVQHLASFNVFLLPDLQIPDISFQPPSLGSA